MTYKIKPAHLKNEASNHNLVEIHGKQTLLTSSLIIAENTGRSHKDVLALAKKYENDLSEVGRVTFQTRPFETKGGVQEQEIALFDDYAAMLLLTHMRSTGAVREFKKRLVQEFKRMRKMLNDPARQSVVRYKRDSGREMADAVKLIRDLLGKETKPHHYINENLTCNRAMFGHYGPVDESKLSAVELENLGKLRRHNTALIGALPRTKDRRTLLEDFAASLRAGSQALLAAA